MVRLPFIKHNQPMQGAKASGVTRWMNEELSLAGRDHLTQALATLDTDMMLQRFFTTMLM